MNPCKCGCGGPCRRTFIRGHNRCSLPGRGAAKRKAVCYTPEYRAFCEAKYRCTNSKSSKWKDYGGRGIRFLFLDFKQFLSEIGNKPTPQHSLDRKDNDGDYAPGNVRWATKAE